MLEEGEVERVGDASLRLAFNVVVATHRDLEARVREEKFRQDLFHRIHVFPLLLPPLRERRDDIPALVEHFAAQVCAQNGWKPVPFTDEAMQGLQSHLWPGNVRELRNMVERLLLLATDGQVDLATVQMALPKISAGAVSARGEVGSGALADRVQSFEREVILAELKRSRRTRWLRRLLGFGQNACIRKRSNWGSIYGRCVGSRSCWIERGVRRATVRAEWVCRGEEDVASYVSTNFFRFRSAASRR